MLYISARGFIAILGGRILRPVKNMGEVSLKV